MDVNNTVQTVVFFSQFLMKRVIACYSAIYYYVHFILNI